jgi:hypothetical protein
MQLRKIPGVALVAIFVAGQFSVPAWAGVTDSVGTKNIGAAAGFSTGYGLSYRHWLKPFGIQGTFAPYYSTDEYETFANVSCGLTFLYLLKEARIINLFLYGGPHFWYYYDKYKDGDLVYSYGDDDTEIDRWLFVGGGPGLDFHFWQVSINLMFGVMFRANLFAGESGVNPTGEIGLYYSW